MSDLDIDGLVKRLETWGTAAALGKHFLGSKTASEDCAEAAAAIRELQAERDRLRALVDTAESRGFERAVELYKLSDAKPWSVHNARAALATPPKSGT